MTDAHRPMNWRERIRENLRVFRSGPKPPLRCQEMVELMTAYLEGALDDRTNARFEQHLQNCDGCSAYLEQLRVTLRLLGSIRAEEIDPVFRDRLLAAFADTAGSW